MSIERRKFLSKIGALGITSILPFKNKIMANMAEAEEPTACVLIPSETRGPFPLFEASQVSSQSALVRSTINETQVGIPLELTITVQNLVCNPISGAKVYIWHCGRNRLYSGYSNNMNPGQAGLTYCRGIQITNAIGQVTFNTIFPPWYNGRLTHIHMEVYVNDVLLRTSQIAFPLDSVTESATQLVNASYGITNNTITNYTGDNVFSDGVSQELITLSGSVAAGYIGTQTFVLDFSPVPIKLLSFNGGVENKNPMLWWTTENELNVSHFEIEQSTHPSKNYFSVGTTVAKNSSTINNYSFSLPQPLPEEINYYRLKIIDKDGRIEYSTVVTIHRKTVASMALINNYATNKIVVSHPVVYKNSLVKIINLSGQLIATGKLTENVTETSMQIGFLKDGMYLLIIESGIDRYVTKFYKGQ